MPRDWHAWWADMNLGRWLGITMQALIFLLLFSALGLALLSSWEHHQHVMQRRAQEQGATEMMVIANQICEARLDRMQGIYTMQIQRQDVILERFREREEERARARMPREDH